jgi:hypothetical protein
MGNAKCWGNGSYEALESESGSESDTNASVAHEDWVFDPPYSGMNTFGEPQIVAVSPVISYFGFHKSSLVAIPLIQQPVQSNEFPDSEEIKQQDTPGECVIAINLEKQPPKKVYLPIRIKREIEVNPNPEANPPDELSDLGGLELEPTNDIGELPENPSSEPNSVVLQELPVPAFTPFEIQFKFDSLVDCTIEVIWGATHISEQSGQFESVPAFSQLKSNFFMTAGLNNIILIGPDAIPLISEENIGNIVNEQVNFYPLVIIFHPGRDHFISQTIF